MASRQSKRFRLDFGMALLAFGAVTFAFGIYSFVKSEPISVHAQVPSSAIDGDIPVSIPVSLQNRTLGKLKIIGNPQCCSSVISPVEDVVVQPLQTVTLNLKLDPRRSAVGVARNQIAIRGESVFGAFEHVGQVEYRVVREK